MLRGVVDGLGRQRKIVPLCDACVTKGWPPPPAPEPTSEISPEPDETG
jgi:hypothetical protein